jgi:uncharacterized phage protein (TIGR01671 family)
MKREIKFRAWNSVTRSFMNPSNLVLRLDGHLFDRELDEELHHVELMQFTSLKDKNGKDIYSDNIISDGKYRCRVYAMYGGFAIKAPSWSKDMSDMGQGDDLVMQPLADAQTASYVSQSMEIIGSIHENPELLK